MRGTVSARCLTILAGSLLVAIVPAYADASASEKGRVNKNDLFGKLDEDGDGRIDRGEFDAWHQTVFLRIDANSDQMINLHDLQAVEDRMLRRSRAAANENSAGNTASAPAGSNRAAQNTASRSVSRRVHRMLRIPEADGDAKCLPGDWRGTRSRLFDGRDVNKDRRNSREELT